MANYEGRHVVWSPYVTPWALRFKGAMNIVVVFFEQVVRSHFDTSTMDFPGITCFRFFVHLYLKSTKVRPIIKPDPVGTRSWTSDSLLSFVPDGRRCIPRHELEALLNQFLVMFNMPVDCRFLFLEVVAASTLKATLPISWSGRQFTLGGCRCCCHVVGGCWDCVCTGGLAGAMKVPLIDRNSGDDKGRPSKTWILHFASHTPRMRVYDWSDQF